MAWLPAFKYLSGLFAGSGEFLQDNGDPYEGSYHRLYNGRTFTGDKPGKDSVEIFLDDSEPHLPDPTYESKVVSEQAFPEPEDYEKGFFIRYFIKDLRVGKIVEVEKSTYDRKEEEKHLLGTTLRWILQKPVKDIFNQGFLFKGAATRNKENTIKASLEMKGLDKFITIYDKFVNIESDVEGYKFEELPEEEKRRIIFKQSPLRKPPALEYPHMMYDPKTGESELVKDEKTHEFYKNKGWVHEKPRFVKKLVPKSRKRGPFQRRTPAPSSSGGGGFSREYDYNPSEESSGEDMGGNYSSPSTNTSQNNYY